MAALSAKRVTKSRGITRKTRYLMTASTTCYAGGMVAIVAAGTAEPAAAASGTKQVVGVAAATVTSASSGSYYVECLEGEFNFTASSIAQTNVGDQLWTVDDQTVDETRPTNMPSAGRLVEFVSSTEGWIRIGPETAIA